MNDYLIQSGDTLSGLARQYGTSVSELQRLNPSITNPDLIRAGETISVPGQTPVSSPETIQGQQPLVLPPEPDNSQVTGLQNLLTELQEQNRVRQEAFDQSSADFQSSMQAMSEFPERAQLIREEEGVADARRGLDEIDSLIASRSRALERQVELLETQGISGGMIARQQNEMYRENVRELADLSLIQNARAGRLETAQMIANERIELELMPLKQQLEFDKFFYEDNRDFLTQSQQQAFQLKIAKEEREYSEERERVQQRTDIMMTAAQYGASPSLIREISNAESVEEAIALASDQLGAAFALQVESARAKASGGGTKPHSASAGITNKLLSLGLTSADIDLLDADVRAYGLAEVIRQLTLSGESQATIEAIVEAYGGGAEMYDVLEEAIAVQNDPALVLMDPQTAGTRPGFFGRIQNIWNNIWR